MVSMVLKAKAALKELQPDILLFKLATQKYEEYSVVLTWPKKSEYDEVKHGIYSSFLNATELKNNGDTRFSPCECLPWGGANSNVYLQSCCDMFPKGKQQFGE